MVKQEGIGGFNKKNNIVKVKIIVWILKYQFYYINWIIKEYSITVQCN